MCIYRYVGIHVHVHVGIHVHVHVYVHVADNMWFIKLQVRTTIHVIVITTYTHYNYFNYVWCYK